MMNDIYKHIDELLLQYCAQELSQEQRAAVERFIALNPDYFDVLSGLRRKIRDMGSVEAVREHKAALKARMYKRLFPSP